MPRASGDAIRSTWLANLHAIVSEKVCRWGHDSNRSAWLCLKSALDRIESGDAAVKRLSGPQVSTHLAKADVILVGDDHAQIAPQVTLGEIISTFASPSLLRAGRVGVALELAWWASQADMDRSRALMIEQPERGVSSFLKEYSRGPGWPTEGYRRSLPTMCRQGVRLLGIEAETTDNVEATRCIVRWIQQQPSQAQVFGFFGSAHVLGQDTISEELRSVGLNVVVVVTSDAVLDMALFERFGLETFDSWYEVMPGMLRAPPAPQVVARAYEDSYDVAEACEALLDKRRRQRVATLVDALGLALEPSKREALIDAQLRRRRRLRASFQSPNGNAKRRAADQEYVETVRKCVPPTSVSTVLRHPKLGMRRRAGGSLGEFPQHE